MREARRTLPLDVGRPPAIMVLITMAVLFLAGASLPAAASGDLTPRVFESISSAAFPDSVVTAVRALAFEGSTAIDYLLSDQTLIGARYAQPELANVPAFTGMALMQLPFFSRAFAKRQKSKWRSLHLGLGVGTLADAGRRELGWVVDCVEIDEAVVRAAASHFGYVRSGPRGETFVEDALDFVRKRNPDEKGEEKSPSLPRYHTIHHDLFTGEAAPLSLLSVETLTLLRRRWLDEHRGLLLVNVVGFSRGPYAALPRAVLATLRAAGFSSVRSFVEPVEEAGVDIGNIVFIASAEGEEGLQFEVPRWAASAEPGTADWYLAEAAAGRLDSLADDNFGDGEESSGGSSIEQGNVITEKDIAAGSPRLAPLAAARSAIHARARDHGREMIEGGGGGSKLWEEVLRSQRDAKERAKTKAKAEGREEL